MVSPQLQAVYQRVGILQQRANNLPESQQTLLSEALEELHAVLEELQASEAELRQQNEVLTNTRQAVELERQRYRELFEFAPDGYLVTDANGRIQEANHAISTLLNVSQSFVVNKPLLIFIDQPDRSSFHLKLDQLQQLDKLQDWQIRLRSPWRSPFDAALTVAVVRDAMGQIVSLRWLLRDITERKHVERLLENLNSELERQVQERTLELQQALDFEAGLKRITDKVRDSLDESQILQTVVQELAHVFSLICCDTALYDLDLGTSTVHYEFTNFVIEGSVGSPSSLGLVISMKTLPETYRQLLQGEYFQFCELPQNSTRHLTILACPIVDDQGILGDLWLFKPQQDSFSESEIRLVQQVANQCAIALRQAQLYEAAQAQVKELERLNQLKDDFLSTISHELRSPIANMKMAIKLLSTVTNEGKNFIKEITKSSAQDNKVVQYFKVLQDECDRELALVEDLLSLQHIEARTYTTQPIPINLRELLPHLIEPFEARAQHQQQTLQVDIAPNLPTLNLDSRSFSRIVTELLSNACKYTPADGTISISARVTQDKTVTPLANSLQLTIINTGVEIAPEELPRVFDKFYRIPNNNPWKHGGTGLGLALVKKLVEQMGGSIIVESANNQTRFEVHLVMPD
jgi:PAS domain S-box-containing protein